MTLRIAIEATAEPVSLTEIKLFLRLPTSDTTEDTMLNSFITAARKHGENLTKRAWVPQTFDLVLDEFPEGGFIIPRPPISSSATDIVINYINTTGGVSTLSATGYDIDAQSEPAYIAPSYENEWPDTREQINAVSVRYVAGYPLSSSSTATTPEACKTWLKMRVGQMYAFREPTIERTISEIPRDYVDGLLDPYLIIDVRP